MWWSQLEGTHDWPGTCFLQYQFTTALLLPTDTLLSMFREISEKKLRLKKTANKENLESNSIATLGFLLFFPLLLMPVANFMSNFQR